MHFAAAIETDSAMNMPSTPATRRRKEPKQVKQSHPLQREEQQISLKKSQQETLRRECASIVLWRRPLQTILFCILELIYLVHHHVNQLISYRKTLCLSSVLLLCSVYFYKTEGAHQTSIRAIESSLFWILYWLGLGIASSIGLGTGLHTFLLYLGPFIARVTLAAYECESVQFPQPPYPKDIICPPANSTLTNGFLATGPVTFWQILWKVKLEAFFWGLGTALGELPPYFMARAARLGQDDNADDEELREFEQLLVNAQLHDRRALTLFERLRYSIYCLIQRIGFWGILLCASIPNPLFDLAGLTCGYFLISFWRFFFATIIGKAVIKMSIQTVFIIFLFSEHHVERIIRWMKHLPYYGRLLQTPFKDWLHEQKGRMHRTSGEQLPAHLTRVSTLSQMFNFFVAAMIGYFIISIINSLAQRYHKRTRSSDCK